MNYTPKHNDNRIRAIYASLIVIAFICMSVGTGLLKTVLMSLSVIFLITGLFLFIKHDLTSFSYIVMENEGRLDFYINKITGKRGNYVCYYPLSDVEALEKYEKGTKKQLYQKYGKVFIYHYAHNRFSEEKYVLVFKNDEYYDAVVCEFDNKNYELLKLGIEKSKSVKAENEE